MGVKSVIQFVRTSSVRTDIIGSLCPGDKPTNELLSAVDASESAIYDALSNRHRRATLRLLADRRQPETLSSLVDALVEADHDRQGRTTEARDWYRVALVHVHLPKLADSGLIEWDRERSTISHSSLVEELAQTTLRPVAEDRAERAR